jgi:hypothetical protein
VVEIYVIYEVTFVGIEPLQLEHFVRGKGKGHPRRGCEDPEEKLR